MGKMRGLYIGLVLAGFSASTAYADSLNQATVMTMTGAAEYKKHGSARWENLQPGTTLSEGDSVRTQKKSEVKMELHGDRKTAEITIRPESAFTFKTFHHDPEKSADNTLLDVELGAVLVKAEKLVGESKFQVKTPTSIVGIRGTVFEVKVTQDK